MTSSEDGLERYLDAQEGGRTGGTYVSALAELQAGEKASHWMWYVFPQLRGLGHSRESTYYGIADLDEARAYLAHPVLGPRLIECATAALRITERSADEVFGPLDALKLHACATLFDLADPAETSFFELRSRFFHGHQHDETLHLLGPGHYVFTEAVLAAGESTPLWRGWGLYRSDPAHVHSYFMRKIGMVAENEDEMALMKLGGNNMGGGVPIQILRLLARLSRIAP